MRSSAKSSAWSESSRSSRVTAPERPPRGSGGESGVVPSPWAASPGSVIHAAKAAGRKIGICGQAPSDYPEFAEFLVEQGIDSISLNPDAMMKATVRILETEARLGRSEPRVASTKMPETGGDR